MTCEQDDCNNPVAVDCAACWPWRGLCEAHIDHHEHEVDEADAAANLAESRALAAEQYRD